MGCGDSKIDHIRYYTEKEESDYLKIGITHRELEKFAAVFRKFDVDGGAELSLNEFLHDIHLQFDPMTFKIFNCIDTHHDNSITFREFILFTWQFCTLTGHDIENFAFDIYDEDGAGSLTKDELRKVLTKVHGKAHVDSKLRALFEIMDTGHSRDITRNEFIAHVKHFPALVFPVFAIQDKLRQAIIGESYWRGLEEGAVKYKQHPQVIKMFEEAGLGRRKDKTAKQRHDDQQSKDVGRTNTRFLDQHGHSLSGNDHAGHLSPHAGGVHGSQELGHTHHQEGAHGEGHSHSGHGHIPTDGHSSSGSGHGQGHGHGTSHSYSHDTAHGSALGHSVTVTQSVTHDSHGHGHSGSSHNKADHHEHGHHEHHHKKKSASHHKGH